MYDVKLRELINRAYSGNVRSVALSTPGKGEDDHHRRCQLNMENGYIRAAVEKQVVNIELWLRLAYADGGVVGEPREYAQGLLLPVWIEFLDSGPALTKHNRETVPLLLWPVITDYAIHCRSEGTAKRASSKELAEIIGVSSDNFRRNYGKYIKSYESILACYDMQGLEAVGKAVARFQ